MTKKKTVTPAVAPEAVAEYRVSTGVSHINGKTVTGDTVKLTREEAMYDLALGRISPVSGPSA